MDLINKSEEKQDNMARDIHSIKEGINRFVNDKASPDILTLRQLESDVANLKAQLEKASQETKLAIEGAITKKFITANHDLEDSLISCMGCNKSVKSSDGNLTRLNYLKACHHLVCDGCLIAEKGKRIANVCPLNKNMGGQVLYPIHFDPSLHVLKL